MSLTVYDKAKWHFGATRAPAGILPEAGATHIAFILRWCIENDLCSKRLLAQAGEEIARIRSGKDDCREFLMTHLDGVFTSEELNAKGKAFLNAYYGSDSTRFAKEHGNSLADYGQFVRKQVGKKNHDNTYFHMDYSETNYQKIKAICDQRHAGFLSMKAAGRKTPKKT
ncbi:hypothetical protein NB640_10765 [Oxalobacter vibrioformis]|uniref:DUF7832 domain-containing protein n=1 Tax=Oxalobacter vibrioformis TaxID=933080 RepID=A0A9E9LU65_9BURK|nr:hypothetical protein [Oxalobacter vibrioformis]WAW09695.1 hypothetical protein NB640_10765 [Oxalobacter vibrioformis]